MIERILKHMNIYKEMKNAAIPLKLIEKKGEDFCMNAARLVNQQELSGLMEGLNEGKNKISCDCHSGWDKIFT